MSRVAKTKVPLNETCYLLGL